MKFGTTEMDETKKAKAAAEEAKAVAEGELETAEKSLAEGSKHLNDLQNECMTKATEYETSQHSRSEELAALAKAKSILEEKTGGASDRAYSFIQVKSASRVGAKEQQAKDKVVNLLQNLAQKDGSQQLSFLVERVESAEMMGEDPFAKIKGLIQKIPSPRSR